MKFKKKTFLYIIVGCILFVGLFIGLNILGEGKKRYEEAISFLPIEVAVSNIQNKEDYLNYEEIDPDFINALVSIEDKRFFERRGIDYISIMRAVVANVISKSYSQGGSTITQQLAKNIYFTNEKDFSRKIAEIFFVNDFESLYSKEEILALYVNIIYYGDGYYGINQASRGYFNKEANKLDLYEASLLAGLPQAPSRYQLSNGFERINKRQKQVLNSMLKEKYISESQYNETLKMQPQTE